MGTLSWCLWFPQDKTSNSVPTNAVINGYGSTTNSCFNNKFTRFLQVEAKRFDIIILEEPKLQYDLFCGFSQRD